MTSSNYTAGHIAYWDSKFPIPDGFIKCQIPRVVDSLASSIGQNKLPKDTIAIIKTSPDKKL